MFRFQLSSIYNCHIWPVAVHCLSSDTCIIFFMILGSFACRHCIRSCFLSTLSVDSLSSFAPSRFLDKERFRCLLRTNCDQESGHGLNTDKTTRRALYRTRALHNDDEYRYCFLLLDDDSASTRRALYKMRTLILLFVFV